MKVLVTGGGTGGHVYPALAVAAALRDDPAVTDILYVGNKTSIESRVIPENGFAFESIEFFGMPRRPGVKFLRWLLSLFKARKDAMAILQKFQPTVVFGTGGYVSGPVLMAANALKIPYVVHEPDAHPGLVNRFTSGGASHVTMAFGEASEKLKGKEHHVTGNPLRRSMGAYTRQSALEKLGLSHWPTDAKILLVTGGSQGAKTINTAVVGALQYLLEDLNLCIIHQSGDKPYEETLANVKAAGFDNHPRYLLRPYFSEMAPVLAAADFAVCRSGSMTLSEMYLNGIPMILVPYPFAAADHQVKNARASEKAGASLFLYDHDCHELDLSEKVAELLEKPETLVKMREAAKKLAHPDATEKIVAILKSCKH